MRKLNKDEKHILALIPHGTERSRPLKELVNLTGLDSWTVRGVIFRLITVHKYPIGVIYSKPSNGYFRITNDPEQSTCFPFTSQILTMTQRAQAISNAKLKSDE